MQVIVQVLFDSPTEDDLGDMRSLARQLTDDRGSIHVAADPEAPKWLVAQFTMPTESQSKAVDKIDRVLRYQVENRSDSRIDFPRSAADMARDQRKNERRKARRKMK